MRFAVRKRKQTPAIIIVSLIDVLIVLLIFMMVSTSFKQRPSIQLALPESKQAAQEGVSQENLVITIANKEPFLYLEARPVTIEKLEQEVSAHVRRNPKTTLSFRADAQAPVGQIVRLMDMAKTLKISKVNLLTQNPAK